MAFRRHRSLTASATIITPNDQRAIQRVVAAYRPWQNTAWDYYDRLAEIHYPANFTGMAISRFTHHVGVIPADDPTAPPAIPTDPASKTNVYKACCDALEALGDVSELARKYALNKMVAADCWLFGEDISRSETKWDILSIRELRPNETGDFVRYPSGGGYQEVLSGSEMTIRMYNAHPAYSSMADGALNPLSDDCNRLIALNDSITSRLLSRLSQAGILFIPNTLTIEGENDRPDGTSQPRDPFLRKILNVMEAAMLNRSTAAGSIPILVRGQSGEGDKIVHITLDRAIDGVEMELRAELRTTIAHGMDLPPEISTGLAGTSHWSSWSIMDSTFRSHLVPVDESWCSSLTQTFLPRAAQACFQAVIGRDMNAAELGELKRMAVVGDGSNVIARPNETKDGLDLSDRLIIGPSALRRRAGASEDDAPDPQEYVRGVGVKMSDPYLATFGLDIQNDIDWDMVATRGPGAPGSAGQGQDSPSKRPADSGDEGSPLPGDGSGPNDDGTGSSSGEENSAASRSLAILMGSAAELALQNADGVIGADLRQRVGSAADRAHLADKIRDVSNRRVVVDLRHDLAEVGLSKLDLPRMYAEALVNLNNDLAKWVPARVLASFVLIVAAERVVALPRSLDAARCAELAFGVLSAYPT